MTVAATSPRPRRVAKLVEPSQPIPSFLDFPDAMQAVIAGQRVTRDDWDDADWYVLLADDFLCIHRAEEPVKQIHAYMANEADVRASDWRVVE